MPNISFMLMLYSTDYHGHDFPPMQVWATCMLGRPLYVTRKYGAVVIVYNGYNGDPTTKDATHLRRTEYCVGVIVHFARGMMIKSKRGEFLYSKTNSQQSTHYFRGNVDRAGCIFDHHANEHADDLTSIQVLHLPDTKALFWSDMIQACWSFYYTMLTWMHIAYSWNQSLNNPHNRTK